MKQKPTANFPALRLPPNGVAAAFLALFALFLALFFLKPAVEVLSEGKDVLTGVLSYCGGAAPSCISFSWERWLQGIAGAWVALGLAYGLGKSAALAWNAPTRRYLLEFDRISVYSLSAASVGLALLFFLEAWKWARLYWIHESAAYYAFLALAALIAAATLYGEARKMSFGEALSIELHRHAQ